jgi:hypothetical protein
MASSRSPSAFIAVTGACGTDHWPTQSTESVVLVSPIYGDLVKAFFIGGG